MTSQEWRLFRGIIPKWPYFRYIYISIATYFSQGRILTLLPSRVARLRHFILDFSVVNDLLHCFNLTWFSSLKLLCWVYSSFWTNAQRLRIVWYMQMLFHLLSVFAVMSAPDYWVVDHVGCTIIVAVTSLFAGASPDFWSTRVFNSWVEMILDLIYGLFFDHATKHSNTQPPRTYSSVISACAKGFQWESRWHRCCRGVNQPCLLLYQ